MKILFLSRWFPFPADNGSKIRIHNLLKGLSKQHEVTLLSFYEPREVSLEEVRSYPFCARVEVVPWHSFNSRSQTAQFGLFRGTPRSLLDTHSPQMDALIRDAICKQHIDVVIASQLTMASYFPAFAGLPAVFEEVELGLYVDQAFHRGPWIYRFRLSLTWFKLQQYFRRLLEAFDTCTVVSEQERQIFTSSFPAYASRVDVFPNCINLEDYQNIQATVKPHRLIFSGSFRYRPNYDAVRWFIEHVYPLIQKKIPDIELVITGDHANLPLPAAKNVILAGYVDDIKSMIASSAVSIAPLWSGGGTRLKILESMAIGTPVVATSKGAEGLLVEHNQHLLIADDPALFAESVIKLLANQEFRSCISANALELVKERYDWSTTLPAFLQLVDKLGTG